MTSVGEMLGSVARRYADRVAVVEGDVTLTYAALQESARAVGNELRSLGIERGDRVALLLPNGVDFVRSFLGCLEAAAVAVPLNPDYQVPELRRLLGECGVSLVVTAAASAGLCREALRGVERSCRVVLIEDVPLELGPPAGGKLPLSSAKAPPLDPNSPLMVQFSSGSTGRPKRVVRTHANLVFELEALVRRLDVRPDDRFIGVAPFFHVNGLVRSMLTSLAAGATLYPVARFERHALLDALERHAISVFIAIPFMFAVLAKGRARAGSGALALRLCVSASAPMPRKLNEQFYARFGSYVRQLYGSTETGSICVNMSADVSRSLESVGLPLSRVEVAILSDEHEPLPAGEVGEVAVKSPAAITAYEAPAEANVESFVDGYFLTGDLGCKDDREVLTLAGRKKFVINKGGYKIDPREVEAVLEAHPDVEEVAVVGQPTAYGDERVKAIVVTSSVCTEESIVEFCRGKIANFKIPSLVEFREQLPRSPTGKLQRALLVGSD